MCGTEKELNEEYASIVGGSPFWQDKSTENLRVALEWRKKELERNNQSIKQAEAKRAIKTLEKELAIRTKGKE